MATETISTFTPMIRENWQLGADEPVDFEKQPVDVHDCRKSTHHFSGIHRRIYPILIKGKSEDVINM